MGCGVLQGCQFIEPLQYLMGHSCNVIAAGLAYFCYQLLLNRFGKGK